MLKMILIVVIALTGSTPSHALGMCGKRQEFVDALLSKYGEEKIGLGTAGKTNLVEIFVSPARTWTVLVTTPNGKACIIAAGKDWEYVTPAVPGTEL